MNLRAPSVCRLVILMFSISLLPGAALAAGDAPIRARLLAEDVPGGSGTPQTREPSSERWHAPRGVRILIEAGAGSLASAAGGLAGGLAAYGLCEATGGGDPRIFGCLFHTVFGIGTGLVVGYPLGVWKGGESVGGDGRLWATALGTLVGVGLGAPLAAMKTSLEFTPFALGAVGGILGYELTQRQEPSALASQRPLFLPSFSVSPQGANLGLSGRF